MFLFSGRGYKIIGLNYAPQCARSYLRLGNNYSLPCVMFCNQIPSLMVDSHIQLLDLMSNNAVQALQPETWGGRPKPEA